MSGIDKLHNVIAIVTRSFAVDNDAIEDLRLILERQKGRKVTHEQAETFGRDLIEVMETLANGKAIVPPKREQT